MGIKIEDSLKIFKCPSCESIHSVIEWDTSTIQTCNNRKVRRRFKSLALEETRNKSSNRCYVCPTCLKFIDGKNIINTL